MCNVVRLTCDVECFFRKILITGYLFLPLGKRQTTEDVSRLISVPIGREVMITRYLFLPLGTRQTTEDVSRYTFASFDRKSCDNWVSIPASRNKADDWGRQPFYFCFLRSEVLDYTSLRRAVNTAKDWYDIPLMSPRWRAGLFHQWRSCVEQYWVYAKRMQLGCLLALWRSSADSQQHRHDC